MDRFTFRAYEYVEFLCMQQTVGYPKIRRFTTKTGFILKDPPRSTWEFPKKAAPWLLNFLALIHQMSANSKHVIPFCRMTPFGVFQRGIPKVTIGFCERQVQKVCPFLEPCANGHPCAGAMQ